MIITFPKKADLYKFNFLRISFGISKNISRTWLDYSKLILSSLVNYHKKKSFHFQLLIEKMTFDCFPIFIIKLLMIHWNSTNIIKKDGPFHNKKYRNNVPCDHLLLRSKTTHSYENLLLIMKVAQTQTKWLSYFLLAPSHAP